MTAKPKPFNVLLSDDEREKLETHRQRLGKRSLGEVIRYWIGLDTAGRINEVKEQALQNIRSGAAFPSGAGGASPSTPSSGGVTSVQFGPTKHPPGSRLKPNKGSKP